MRQYHLAAAMLLAVILSGCGGGGAGDQSPKIKFASQVSFGDSLSDVGTYKVGSIAAAGGGQFTINGVGKNWIELMAAQLGLPAPCAAVKGGYGSAAQPQPGCYGYAQGGARVANQPGIGYTGTIAGALTYPVAQQVANHGSFSGNEIVFVLAGANDIFYEATVNAAAPATAVANVATAAGDLVTNINTIISSGARYVVVVNVPDIADTPMAISQGVAAQGFFDQLVNAFNSTLKAGLANNANVLLVDAYTINHDQILNPTAYGLTNVTSTACNTAILPGNSSLFCTAGTLNSGTVDHYLFADGVHPTPYGYLLLARLVSKEMLVKGWL